MSEEDFLICDWCLPGFSLTTKSWGLFSVAGIQDIIYQSTAFDSLVLAQDKKALLSSLINAQGNEETVFDDLIDGKGRGLIVLLHGPPGVGKTFTAGNLKPYELN